jgi:ABC-type Na+ transport system ATPase subunit NatA
MADLARFEMLQSREDVAQTKDHQALNFSDGIKAQTKSARALAEAAQVNFVVNEYPIYAKINGEEVEAPDRKAGNRH